MRRHFALVALVFILAVVNYAIADKERHLARGETVYLQLAPVDPRSLMQGDYMALRFGIADQIKSALPTPNPVEAAQAISRVSDGFVVVGVDDRGVGTFRRLDQGETLAEDEVRMQYRVRNAKVRFASNAFFFEQGRGGEFARARFGEFRVDTDGELLLVAMRDEELKKLGPAEK